jgi:hypothetical protein
MTITRAEFQHAGTHYAAIFEPMTEEDPTPTSGHRNRKKSGSRYHLAVREISDGHELAVLVADYAVGRGCTSPSVYPGLATQATTLMRLAGRAFTSATETHKYTTKQCCSGKARDRCEVCKRVQQLLDEDTMKRIELRESGQWRDMERRRRRTHCHHKGRRRSEAS